MIFNQFIGKNSSGVLDAYAVIGVEYPAGSVCTCAKGSTVLQAEDTLGRTMFGVPEAGDWVITITDGTETKTQTVSITEQYQIESILLTYSTYLFKSGLGALVTITPYVTTNVMVDRPGTAIVTNDSIQIASIAYAYDVTDFSCGMVSTDAIDVTDISTLHVDGEGYFKVFVSSSRAVPRYQQVFNSSARGTQSFDISSVTGNMMFELYCSAHMGGAYALSEHGTIYNWWYE